MTDNTLNEMFDYLKDFMSEMKDFMPKGSWYDDDENVTQQARSIFTTICVMWDVRADTAPCDNMLYELWQCAGIDEVGIKYDEFENFMVAWLV